MGEIITKVVHPSKLFDMPAKEQLTRAFLEGQKKGSLVNDKIAMYRHPEGYIFRLCMYTEDGNYYANLVGLTDPRYSKKQEWSFGYIDKDNNIVFLFNGKPMAESRELAKQAFLPVYKYVSSNNLGAAFMYKLQS